MTGGHLVACSRHYLGALVARAAREGIPACARVLRVGLAPARRTHARSARRAQPAVRAGHVRNLAAAHFPSVAVSLRGGRHAATKSNRRPNRRIQEHERDAQEGFTCFAPIARQNALEEERVKKRVVTCPKAIAKMTTIRITTAAAAAAAIARSSSISSSCEPRERWGAR